MTRHRYSLGLFVGDEIKAGAGLILTGGPLLFSGLSTVVFTILAAVAALFVIYAVRVALRHLTAIDVSDEMICAVGPLPARIEWTRLRSVRLRYYSTRRDRERGWMYLTVRGPDATIRIESSIEGFAAIACRAASEAERHGLELNAQTRTNLQGLGPAAP
ncbi:MAG TPA: hypothetical protein QF665_06410 [Alphaproteobacteria bacterium]|nr:hypothetical protein [Alphaproteobacteria bacterium]